MIVTDALRDRLDDVIADMERQFVPISAQLAPVADDVLAGNRAAYGQMQSVGRQVLAPMIDHYGLTAGSIAAEWYDLNRDLARVGGAWSGAVLQDPNIDTGPMVGGAVKGFTSVETIMSGIQAGMGMRVRQAAQGTIMDSTLRDPSATGWGRVASPGCCSYCAMLAARGNVYRTQFTATFMPHTNCRCTAAPAWGGSTAALRSREDTIATRRTLTAEQRATQNSQARSWIEQNKDTLGLL